MSNYIQHYIDKILVVFLDIKNYDNENKVVYHCAMTIGTLIEHSANDVNGYMEELLKKLVMYLEMTKTISNFNNNKEIQENYQVYLCTCISSILIGQRFLLNSDQFNYLYEIISQMFEEKKDIFPEGMMVISSLCSSKIIIIINILFIISFNWIIGYVLTILFNLFTFLALFCFLLFYFFIFIIIFFK